MSYTSSKLTESLVGKELQDLTELPNRDEVINFFARSRYRGSPCYPRGWRRLLKLPEDFMQSVGGCGDEPVELIKLNPSLYR